MENLSVGQIEKMIMVMVCGVLATDAKTIAPSDAEQMLGSFDSLAEMIKAQLGLDLKVDNLPALIESWKKETKAPR